MDSLLNPKARFVLTFRSTLGFPSSSPESFSNCLIVERKSIASPPTLTRYEFPLRVILTEKSSLRLNEARLNLALVTPPPDTCRLPKAENPSPRRFRFLMSIFCGSPGSEFPSADPPCGITSKRAEPFTPLPLDQPIQGNSNSALVRSASISCRPSRCNIVVR